VILLLAAALPTLYWDAPPSTARAVREAGIASIRVPVERIDKWRNAAGIAVEPAELKGTIKLIAPSVQYRPNAATASRAPWLDSNGWQFLRYPHARFYYDVPGPKAALAAAEAYCFGGDALIRTDADGLAPLGAMLNFLRGLGPNDRLDVADIGFIDNGLEDAGEVMNLMVRNNLLFTPVARPDPRYKITVGPSLPDAANPSMAAHDIRARLTDDKRSLRIYGSPVVIGRLTTLPEGVRVHLLNYAATERKVTGLRVHVAGRYPRHNGADLLDYTVEEDATEFTLSELASYTVVDLLR
jgi:hypothetical protein